jgi:glycerol-3-phosphate dehydrogenase
MMWSAPFPACSRSLAVGRRIRRKNRTTMLSGRSPGCSVTGGKLTTFRHIAIDALKAARKHLPQMPEPKADMPVLSPVNLPLGRANLSEAERRRLHGRYGAKAPALVAAARPGELDRIAGAAVGFAVASPRAQPPPPACWLASAIGREKGERNRT